MTGREGPGPERPGPDYPPEWDTEPDEEGPYADVPPGFYVTEDPDRGEVLVPIPEATRERGECLSGNPGQWCRWNSECRSCAPVAGSSYAAPSPDPWATQGPVPPPPF